MTTFNGALQSHTRDWQREEFYRMQEAERLTREHAERSARWIAGKLQGHQYDTLAAMERSVVELVTEWQQGEPDEEMMATIHRACVLIWVGTVDRDAMYRRCVERSAEGVRFTVAA
jgi:hypothetical protein